jgi:hypothetical protein
VRWLVLAATLDWEINVAHEDFPSGMAFENIDAALDEVGGRVAVTVAGLPDYAHALAVRGHSGHTGARVGHIVGGGIGTLVFAEVI